ncbi:MAG: molybdate ABC transporter substrate-binding protein [Actinomycetota bacterium]
MVACVAPSPDAGSDATAADRQSGSGIRVAAASDLQFAMPALIERFQKDHPDIRVDPTFGSSGNFFAQLRNEAPFDMYFSADVRYPQRLGEQGLLADDSLFEYAVGRVVVAVRAGSSLDVDTLGLEALTEPSVRKIAIANPQHAPYGVAAEEAIRSYGLYDQVADRLVLGENVTQTAQFIDSGAADVGIIALSLALAPAWGGSYVEIPADKHNEILQGGAIMAEAQDPEAARLFREFLLSEPGKKILVDFGFALPSGRTGE